MKKFEVLAAFLLFTCICNIRLLNIKPKFVVANLLSLSLKILNQLACREPLKPKHKTLWTLIFMKYFVPFYYWTEVVF